MPVPTKHLAERFGRRRRDAADRAKYAQERLRLRRRPYPEDGPENLGKGCLLRFRRRW